MYHEYSYEVVRKFNQERRDKAQRRRVLLETTSDGYAPIVRTNAEVIEVAFGFDCGNSESIGA